MSQTFRQNVANKARGIWDSNPVFLDTETTGLNNTAEIVEISIIDREGSVLLDTLVKPVSRIPADASQLHGITNEMVGLSPNWLEVWPQVEKILQGRHVGIYNADFDLRMMRQSHRIMGLPWRQPKSQFFCIMRLYADFSGSGKWLKLEQAGRQCGIPLPNSHRAQDDSLLARAVFAHMVQDGARDWR